MRQARPGAGDASGAVWAGAFAAAAVYLLLRVRMLGPLDPETARSMPSWTRGLDLACAALPCALFAAVDRVAAAFWVQQIGLVLAPAVLAIWWHPESRLFVWLAFGVGLCGFALAIVRCARAVTHAGLPVFAITWTTLMQLEATGAWFAVVGLFPR